MRRNIPGGAASPSSKPPEPAPVASRRGIVGYIIGGSVAGLLSLGGAYWGLEVFHRPAAASAPTVAPVPRIESMACWFPVPAGRAVQCGDLIVRENRDAPNGKTIRLRFVVLGAVDPRGLAPLIYLNGGPGVATGLDADGIAHWLSTTGDDAWLNRQDVVLFDQRGVGLSQPSLACPGLTEAAGRVFTSDMTQTAAGDLWRQAAGACYTRLLKDGVSVEQYNTKANAQDLAALVEQLGYPSWRIYAVSYGTRLALEFMRDHPAGTESVILDSPYPPNVQAYAEAPGNAAHAFGAIFQACAGQPACAKANPRLEAVFQDTVGQSRAQPLTVKLADGRSVVLDDDKLIETLFYGFYGWGEIRKLPGVITALGHGDTGPLQPLVTEALATLGSPDVSYGTFLSVECHDEWGFNPASVVAEAARQSGPFEAFALANLPVVACPVWPAGTAAPDSKAVVQSDVPALILSGELDPITPPDWAARAASGLTHSFVIHFPGVGHGVVASHGCADRLAAMFLADSTKAPYDDCLLALGQGE